MLLLLLLLKGGTIKFTVVLTIDHLCFHLVVNAHISSLRLFIILKLDLYLLGGQIRCTLSLLLFVGWDAVLTVAELVLHVERLLLLQMEILDGLVVLSILAFVRLLHRLVGVRLHASCLGGGATGLLLHLRLGCLQHSQFLAVVIVVHLELTHILCNLHLLLLKLLSHLHILLVSRLLYLSFALVVILSKEFNLLVNFLEVLHDLLRVNLAGGSGAGHSCLLLLLLGLQGGSRLATLDIGVDHLLLLILHIVGHGLWILLLLTCRFLHRLLLLLELLLLL